MSWTVEHVRVSASAAHASDVPDQARRLVRVCEVTGPAVVLGSTQREDVVDHGACAAMGFEVVRRRSGGGAVLVVPGELVWVDVVVPRGDDLWDPDVTRSFNWLGQAWVEALRDLGVHSRAHDGGLVCSRWSRQVCFAGVGAGEVLDGSGAKMVGIAQRRTRAAARFQCAALLRWDPVPLVRALRLPVEASAELAGVAAAVPAGIGAEAIVERVVRNLP